MQPITRRPLFLCTLLMMALLVATSALSPARAALPPGPTVNETSKIVASDGADGNSFGLVVATSGNSAIIGAPFRSPSAAYVVVKNGTSYTEQQILTPSVADGQFGSSVAIDGDTAIVGAYGADSNKGSAFVFTRSGTTWTQQARLTASDGVANDLFGYSVAISGDTAVIGVYGRNSLAGAVYVFVRSGTNWTAQATLTLASPAAQDFFGVAVAASGDTALIGAYGINGQTGAAYIYNRSGTSWTLGATLTGSNAAASDWFGVSVALQGTGAIVGAQFKNNNQGAAYVFVLNGSTWSEQQKLTASDAANDAVYGSAVAIDGNNVLVGANSANGYTGRGYFYTRSGTTWTEQAKLNISDATGADAVGNAVVFLPGVALVGAPGNNLNQGAVYTYALTLAPTSTPTATATNTATATFTATKTNTPTSTVTPSNTPTNTPTRTNTPTLTPVPQFDTVGVYRPSNNTFYLRRSNTAGYADIAAVYGFLPNLMPVAGDWNNDGIDGLGVYDTTTGNYRLTNSLSPGQYSADYVLTFGIPNDTPLAGKWSRDMVGDGIGVYRPSNGVLYLRKTLTTGYADFAMVLGLPSDQGIAGDWNGDGISTIGVFRPSEGRFYLSNTNTSGVIYGDIAFYFGANGHRAFAGDWIGQGYSGVGVFIPSGSTMALRNQLTTGYANNAFLFGTAGDLPVAGRWGSGSRPNPITVITNPSLTNGGEGGAE